jgi:hypothetical protein
LIYLDQKKNQKIRKQVKVFTSVHLCGKRVFEELLLAKLKKNEDTMRICQNVSHLRQTEVILYGEQKQ